MSDIRSFATADEVAAAAAALFVTLATNAVEERGVFLCALAGGRTPLSCYRILGTPPLSSKVDWGRTHVFWSDERCVPEGHLDRNDGAAFDALLLEVPIPSTNVHRVDAAAPDAAGRYQSEISRCFSPLLEPTEIPRFDLILLGLGPDGHTASLFPGHPAVEAKDRLVVRVDGAPTPPSARITFTLPLINAAMNVMFLVTGKDKHAALERVLRGDSALPAARVAPRGGALVFLADSAALTGTETFAR